MEELNLSQKTKETQSKWLPKIKHLLTKIPVFEADPIFKVIILEGQTSLEGIRTSHVSGMATGGGSYLKIRATKSNPNKFRKPMECHQGGGREHT